MTKRIISTILVCVLLFSLCLSLASCGEVSFKSITGIDSFTEIAKIVIVSNIYAHNGHVEHAFLKEYILEKDILEIYNILSRADYRREKVDGSRVPQYIIEIYVKDKDGYIEYQWDKSFSKCDYTGKLKSGEYSMDEADKFMAKIDEIFNR